MYEDDIIQIEKPLELIGEGPREQIIVKCADNTCLYVNTYEALIHGLTFHSHLDHFGYPAQETIHIAGNAVIENCHVIVSGQTGRSCLAVFPRPSYAEGAPPPHTLAPIPHPIIRHCILEGGDAGVAVLGQGVLTAEDCDFSKHKIGCNMTLSEEVQYGDEDFYGAEDYYEVPSGEEDDRLTIDPEGSLYLRRCIFHDGSETALWLTRAMVEECLIRGGYHTGVTLQCDQGDVTLRKTTILRSQFWGVKIFGWEGRWLLEACTISGNGGDGVYVGGSGATIRRCKINQNKHAISIHAPLVVEDCDLLDNTYGSWDRRNLDEVARINNKEQRFRY